MNRTFRETVLILFALASASAALAQDKAAPATTPENAIKQVTDGIGSVLGAIFNPTETTFRAAMKERRLDDALAIYDKDSLGLQNNAELKPSIQTLLDYARTRNGAEIEAWNSRVSGMRKGKLYLNDVAAYLAVIKTSADLTNRYLEAARIVRDFKSTDPLLARMAVEEQVARESLRVELATVYAAFPHERLSFQEVVGTVASESDLLNANWAILNQKIESLNEPEVQALVKNTTTAWSSNPELRARVSAAVWKKVAPPNAGPVASVQTAARVEKFGLSKSDVPSRPRIYVVDSSTGAADMVVKFSSNHDGALKSSSDLMSISGGEVPTIVIEVQESMAKRTIVDKKEISSEYRSGSQSLPNPNYSIAKMNCQRAQVDLSAQNTRNTIAPAQGWAGAILQGVAAGLAAGNAERICGEFASTPPTVEQSVYTPYSYTVTDIQVTRSVRGRVLAVNPASGDFETYPVALEESEMVSVAYGRKEGDRGSSTSAITDADLEKAASREFKLDAERLVLSLEPSKRTSRARSDLLATLSENPRRTMPGPSVATMANTGSTTETASRPVAFAQRPPASDVTALDDRMQSVVVVLNPKGSIGAGFYVDTNEILTNYHVVEGASTVELRGLDGQLFTGRVVRKDIGVDLALVRVERTGIPVQFSQSIMKPGDSVDAIGHPKGLYFSVSRGIVSAVRQMKGVLAQGGDKALVIQTDAQINPGNSGGPLFFKDRVVGVNTLKFRGADGIGFAVHYSEALRFLSQQ